MHIPQGQTVSNAEFTHEWQRALAGGISTRQRMVKDGAKEKWIPKRPAKRRIHPIRYKP